MATAAKEYEEQKFCRRNGAAKDKENFCTDSCVKHASNSQLESNHDLVPSRNDGSFKAKEAGHGARPLIDFRERSRPTE